MARVLKRANRKIAMHNILIDSQFSMTISEIRIFLKMLEQIKKGDDEFAEMNVKISDVQEGHYIHSYINDVTDSMMAQTIVFHYEDEKGRKRTKKYNLISQCDYSAENFDGIIKCKFNDDAKELLLNLTSNFTTAEVNVLATLRSFYSFRIYLMLRKEKFKGNIIEIEIDELKQRLDISGKYSVYSDFKKRIIEKAKEELKWTDCEFEYRPIKTGKKVTAIQFIIIKKNQLQINNFDKDAELPDKNLLPESDHLIKLYSQKSANNKNLTTRLFNIGLHKSQVLKVIEQLKKFDDKQEKDFKKFIHSNIYIPMFTDKGEQRNISNREMKSWVLIKNYLKIE